MMGSNRRDVRLSVAVRSSGEIGGAGGEARSCRGDGEEEDLADMFRTDISDLESGSSAQAQAYLICE